jgi:hypothetical protein
MATRPGCRAPSDGTRVCDMATVRTAQSLAFTTPIGQDTHARAVVWAVSVGVLAGGQVLLVLALTRLLAQACQPASSGPTSATLDACQTRLAP